MPDTRDTIATTARTFYQAFSPGSTHLLAAAVSEKWVDHTLPAGRAPGRSGMLQAIQLLHHILPDLQTDVLRMLIDGDLVTVHLQFRGTHRGEFFGAAPSNKPVTFQAFDMHRVREGQIVESWHLEDNLAFFLQLGVLPPLQPGGEPEVKKP